MFIKYYKETIYKLNAEYFPWDLLSVVKIISSNGCCLGEIGFLITMAVLKDGGPSPLGRLTWYSHTPNILLIPSRASLSKA